MISILNDLNIWIHSNPEYALFFAFSMSFIESLTIIGSIVPGTVTMTMIGTMMGSGLISTQYAVFLIILGALLGDYLSFLLVCILRITFYH